MFSFYLHQYILKYLTKAVYNLGVFSLRGTRIRFAKGSEVIVKESQSYQQWLSFSRMKFLSFFLDPKSYFYASVPLLPNCVALVDLHKTIFDDNYFNCFQRIQ